MTPRRPLLAAVLAAAVLSSGCGSSKLPSPAGAAAPPATSSPALAATAEPREASSGAASSGAASSGAASSEAARRSTRSSPPGASAASASVIPTFDAHAVPSLEALLPSRLAGQTFSKVSFSLAEPGIASGADDALFSRWLGALGRQPGDVDVAVASDESGAGIAIGATRVNGADPGRLLATYLAAAESEQIRVSRLVLGGRQVAKLVDGANADQVTYVYTKGDVLFFVESDDRSVAAAALASLP